MEPLNSTAHQLEPPRKKQKIEEHVSTFPLFSLPHELIAHIFSFLPYGDFVKMTTLVCKQLRQFRCDSQALAHYPSEFRTAQRLRENQPIRKLSFMLKEAINVQRISKILFCDHYMLFMFRSKTTQPVSQKICMINLLSDPDKIDYQVRDIQQASRIYRLSPYCFAIGEKLSIVSPFCKPKQLIFLKEGKLEIINNTYKNTFVQKKVNFIFQQVIKNQQMQLILRKPENIDEEFLKFDLEGWPNVRDINSNYFLIDKWRDEHYFYSLIDGKTLEFPSRENFLQEKRQQLIFWKQMFHIFKGSSIYMMDLLSKTNEPYTIALTRFDGKESKTWELDVINKKTDSSIEKRESWPLIDFLKVEEENENKTSFILIEKAFDFTKSEIHQIIENKEENKYMSHPILDLYLPEHKVDKLTDFYMITSNKSQITVTTPKPPHMSFNLSTETTSRCYPEHFDLERSGTRYSEGRIAIFTSQRKDQERALKVEILEF